MSGTKHTPGPWRLGNDQEGNDTMIIGPYTVCIAQGMHRALGTAIPNARLIASAPAMLEALKRISILSHGTQSAHLKIAAMNEAACAAIAAAACEEY